MDFGVRGIGGEIKLFPPPTYHGELEKWEDWSCQLKICRTVQTTGQNVDG